MKRLVIGYIFSGRKPGKDEFYFMNIAKKENISIILINVSKEIDEEKLKEKLDGCRVIFNNSAEENAMEYVKTFEEWGKRVIDSSDSYYNTEDKWIFYLKCIENKIPTPKTELLSENINLAKKELNKFNRWPVIIKRVEGTCGDYVEMARNNKEAGLMIKKIYKKGGGKQPIIAQEYIPSPSYRVTLIGKKIVQTAIKENKSGWKSTGIYEKTFERFRPDWKLKRMIKKIRKFSNIKVCGLDFVKKDGRWLVLEANAQPAFDFFEDERERLIYLTIKLLRKEAKKTRDHPVSSS